MKSDLISKILLALVGIIFGTGLWWLFEPADPPIVDWRMNPQDKDGKPKTDFRPGETLYSHGVFTVKRDIVRTTFKSIVNEDTRAVYGVYQPQIEYLKAGKYERVFPNYLPEIWPTGNYTYRITVTYALNPLQPTVGMEPYIVRFRIVK